MNPYTTVEALEKKVAEYAESPYAVAVDSCTNALTLCLKLEHPEVVILPKRTYVGVAYAVINSGAVCEFKDINWRGAYKLGNTNIIDSARRFYQGMYVPGTLCCLSAHWGKHLKIGRGGFILTDNAEKARILRIMRFDGRTAGVEPEKDNFIYPGMHCYMLPEEAARGIMLMNYMPYENDDLPWDNYPDLSQFEIFKRKK